MIDSDFVQWIVVPDDRPTLPPVDEDMSCLKDLSSLEMPIDLHIELGYDEPSGLLLGPDLCAHQGANTFDAVTLLHGSPEAAQNTFFPASDPLPSQISSYSSLFPPALSPDSSPASAASSTPWLRTPGTDLSFADVASVDTQQDTMETKEESCSVVHFVDQAGNSLEDILSQVQDVMLEDIACPPQTISDASFNTFPCSVPPTPSHAAIFVISSPCASASPTEAMPSEQVLCTSSFRSSPHLPRSLFASSPVTCYPQEMPLPRYSASPSLSPLSTLSFLSQSQSATPNPSPLVSCSSLSPAILPVPLSDGGERVGATGSLSSPSAGVTSAKLRGKRRAGTPDDDAPPWKMPRRSRAKNVDEEEWNPKFVRVKHPRVAASFQSTSQTSIPNCPQDEISNCEGGQGSERDADATHTSCDMCGQEFTRASDYIRHLENSASHPETRKVWPCPYCDSTLGRKDALGRHVKTMHPGRPVVNWEGVPGGQLPEGQKGPSAQRIGQRKVRLRRQSKKDTYRH